MAGATTVALLCLARTTGKFVWEISLLLQTSKRKGGWKIAVLKEKRAGEAAIPASNNGPHPGLSSYIRGIRKTRTMKALPMSLFAGDESRSVGTLIYRC
jgi:hypothetical protein